MISNKKFLLSSFFLILLIGLVFSETMTNTDVEDENIDQKIEKLLLEVEKEKQVTKKITLYKEISILYEFSAMYDEASIFYEKVAVLDKENYVDLYLQSAKCALCSGNTERTDKILVKISDQVKNTDKAPLLKLYAVWSWLVKSSSYDDTLEPLSILKTYLETDSMKSVKPEILYTLFYVTGEEKYLTQLKKEFPSSQESYLVQNSAQLMPTPFWFFLVRNTSQKIETSTSNIQVAKSIVKNSPKKDEINVNDKQNEVSENSKLNKVKYYQLGFFASLENANRLVARVKEKNITAKIIQEKKESGNVYYAVVVYENTTNDMGLIIKNSGFECSPIY